MRNSILCKWRGALVLIEISKLPSGQSGQCFDCGEKEFKYGPHDWLECQNCSFALCGSHYREIHNHENIKR